MILIWVLCFSQFSYLLITFSALSVYLALGLGISHLGSFSPHGTASLETLSPGLHVPLWKSSVLQLCLEATLNQHYHTQAQFKSTNNISLIFKYMAFSLLVFWFSSIEVKLGNNIDLFHSCWQADQRWNCTFLVDQNMLFQFSMWLSHTLVQPWMQNHYDPRYVKSATMYFVSSLLHFLGFATASVIPTSV